MEIAINKDRSNSNTRRSKSASTDSKNKNTEKEEATKLMKKILDFQTNKSCLEDNIKKSNKSKVADMSNDEGIVSSNFSNKGNEDQSKKCKRKFNKVLEVENDEKNSFIPEEAVTTDESPVASRKSTRKRKLSSKHYDEDFIIFTGPTKYSKELKENKTTKRGTKLNEFLSKDSENADDNEEFELRVKHSKKFVRSYSRKSLNSPEIVTAEKRKVESDDKINQNEDTGTNENETEVMSTEKLQTKDDKITSEDLKSEQLNTKEVITGGTKRKRGRPKKIVTITEKKKVDVKTEQPIRRPGRPRKHPKSEKEVNKDTENLSDDHTENICKSNNKNVCEGNTEDGTLGVTSDDKEIKSTTVPRGKNHKNKRIRVKSKCENDENTVQCGVCEQEMKSGRWYTHKVKHNDLCWKVGEPEIDLQDEKLVNYILIKHLKKKKHLLCFECGVKKKSVFGLLSHKEQCNKSKEEILALRIPCPICDRKMQPFSLKVHMYTIHNNNPKKQKPVTEPSVIITSDAPDGKCQREAARKAASLIQEVTEDETDNSFSKKIEKYYKKMNDTIKKITTNTIIQSYMRLLKKEKFVKCKVKNCTFVTEELNDIKDHINKCPKLQETDCVCRYCLFVTNSEPIMLQHVKKKHFKVKNENFDASEDDESEDEDKEEVKDEKSQQKTLLKKVKKVYQTPKKGK